MALIKLHAAEKTPLIPVRYALRDIEGDARALIDQARREAEELIADANARAAEIAADAKIRGESAGHADGFARGNDEGIEQGRRDAVLQRAEELELLVAALSQAAEELQAARAELEGDVLGDAVELAIAIARRVTKTQAAIDPQVLLANMREALKLVGRNHHVRIAVHPSQRRVLEEVLPQLQLEWPAMTCESIVEDESIGSGGCRVYTPHGKIDADIEAQLDRVVRELLPSTRSEDGTGDATEPR